MTELDAGGCIWHLMEPVLGCFRCSDIVRARKGPAYVVWRRSDGYVGGMVGLPADHGSSTFEKLLETRDWYGVAVPRIEQERAADDRAAGKHFPGGT